MPGLAADRGRDQSLPRARPKAPPGETQKLASDGCRPFQRHRVIRIRWITGRLQASKNEIVRGATTRILLRRTRLERETWIEPATLCLEDRVLEILAPPSSTRQFPPQNEPFRASDSGRAEHL